jgi:hypothetical protein
MVLMVVATAHAVAEDSTRTIRVGAGLFGGVNVHVADFSSLPELPSCCPRFQQGSGLSAAGMLWGEYPVFGSLAVGLRVGFGSIGGLLRSLERKPVLIDDTPTEAVIQHTLSATVRAMRWEAYAAVRASALLDVYLGAGTDVIQTADATIREELVQPDRGTFENGERIRNQRAATLASAPRAMTSLVAGMRVAVGLDSDRRWSLIPELSFRYALDRLVRSSQWYVYSVMVGVGLAFEPSPYRVAPEAPRQPPVYVPSSVRPLEASIVAYGVRGGREQLPLRLRRYGRLRVMPLYPVLYTDGRTELPERYVLPLSPSDSSWRSTLGSPLAAYYAVLPIIAQRLRSWGDTLVITGYDSRTLVRARSRAEFVARYLRAVWNVPAEQLRISARIDERDTTARVELASTSGRLLEPVEERDTIQQIEPLLLRLRPGTNGAQPLRRWNVQLRQDRTTLALHQGSGGLPLRLDIDLTEHADRLRDDQPLVAEVNLESTDGTEVSAQTTIPIERESGAAEAAETVVEYFFFPVARPPAAFASSLAAMYLHRLRDVAITAYGNSLEHRDAVTYLERLLTSAGFPSPRVQIQELLYRPITPERIVYGNMIAVHLRVAD